MTAKELYNQLGWQLMIHIFEELSFFLDDLRKYGEPVLNFKFFNFSRANLFTIFNEIKPCWMDLNILAVHSYSFRVNDVIR